MIFKKDRSGRMGAGAFVRKQTTGTSNELSFSVLESKSASSMSTKSGKAKGKAKGSRAGLGSISVFTLPGRSKKVSATPEKDKGLILQSGEFVSSGPVVSTDDYVPGSVSLESSDILTQKKSQAVVTPAGSAPSPSRPAPPPKEPPSPEQKKKRRKILGVTGGVLGTVVVIAAVALFAWQAYLQMDKEHQNQYARLRTAITDIVKVDNMLLTMDQVLSNPINVGSFDKMVEIEGTAEEFDANLNEAEAIAIEVSKEASDADDRRAADNALDAVEARREMRDAGMELLAASKAGAQMVEMVLSAWDKIYYADDLARKAAEIVARADGDLNEAAALSASAYTEMSSAREMLYAVDTMNSSSDLSLQISYVAKRMEALHYTSLSMNALLVDDVAAAQENADHANAIEQEAAEMAAELPEEKAEGTIKPYNENVKDLVQKYRVSRENAAQADALLRNYLGR